VRISNAYGNRPLGTAMIALRDKGPTIVAGTGRKLSFGGRNSAVIAARAVQYSDAVDLSVGAMVTSTRERFGSETRQVECARDFSPRHSA
jgi:hypothetical protein